MTGTARPEHANRLTTLRRAISAGAPASAASLERFVKLLPESAQVFTPYGATEALPVANIGSREILAETRHLTDQGRGVCVGRPVPGMEVSVIAISDEPVPEWTDALKLPPGEIGEFVVRGPVVTKRYFNRPEATALAKIRDPRTGEVLHRMGDVGYIDDNGRLWFCGRKSHRVVTPHGTLFTDMVEPIFNTVPGVARTALVGATWDGVVYAVLCFEQTPTSPIDDRKRIIEEMRGLAEQFPHTQLLNKVFNNIIRYPWPLPVDVRHNSKIAREKLAAWVQLVGWCPVDENSGVKPAKAGAKT